MIDFIERLQDQRNGYPGCSSLQVDDRMIIRGYIFGKEVSHPARAGFLLWSLFWSSGLCDYRSLCHYPCASHPALCCRHHRMNVGATDMQGLRVFALYLHQMYREPLCICHWYMVLVLGPRLTTKGR